MIGALLAIAGAFCLCAADAMKKHLSQVIDPFVVNWTVLTAGALLGAGYCVFAPTAGIPPIDARLVELYLAAVLFSFFGEITFMNALQRADFSVVMPLCALFPLSILLFGIVFLGEVPTGLALVGVLLVIGGIYALGESSSLSETSHIKRLMQMLSTPAALWMGACAFCLGAMVTISKITADVIDSPIFIGAVLAGSATTFLCANLLRGVSTISELRRDRRTALLMGMSWGLGYQLSFVANTYMLVSHVAAIQQIIQPTSVLIGYFVFREKAVRERLIASAFMLTGVMLVVLYGRQ